MSISLKYHNYIEFLEYRIESIKKNLSALEKALPTEKKEKRKQYYLSVAYYIHAIYERYELKFIFDELIGYNQHLSQDRQYISAVKKINKSIQRIAKFILEHRRFEDFERKENSVNWTNPFDSTPLLKLRNLLIALKSNEKPLRFSYDEVYSIFASNDGLNGILNRFSRITTVGFNKVFKELSEFRRNLRVIAFHEKFQSDYLGVGSAEKLQLIYHGLHPLFPSSEINESLYKSLLNNGDDIVESNNLLLHCITVKDYIAQRINTKLSINISIIRFKHYMEIFYKPEEQTSERVFAKEFELFMFNNGYFALSEGQIGNARYDTIIMNSDNAFLCEHKQIGFQNSKGSIAQQITRLYSAKIQAKIYHERLALFPGISPIIYIIIFSKVYLQFKDTIQSIDKDGINFQFIIIELDEVVPSKRQPQEIDINNLFK